MKKFTRLVVDLFLTVGLAALLAFIATYVVAVLAVYFGLSHQLWGIIGSLVTSAVFVFVIVFRFMSKSRRR